MTDGPFRRLLGLARRAAADPTDDNRVLARFAAGGDADAFELLVWRHGGMVLGVCQGTTTEEAARRLGCPRGTVLSRLAAARAKLRARLSKRGVAPSVLPPALLPPVIHGGLTDEAVRAAVAGSAAPRVMDL